MEIRKRLDALRNAMAAAGLDAYIDTGADPHGSEYPPSMWRTRKWLTGFSGSAGTFVVTKSAAGLWTDFRYWIQAPGELDGSGIELFKDGEIGVPQAVDWIAEALPAGSVVGADGRTVTEKTASEWEETLERAGIVLKSDVDLLSGLWEGRPHLPEPNVVELDEAESGESRSRRIERLRQALREDGADTWIGTGLDSVAWLLNVRGNDVPYNPVIVGFLLVVPDGVTWFVERERIPEAVRKSLETDGIGIAPYGDVYGDLSALSAESRILVDPASVSRAVYMALPEGTAIRIGRDPVAAMKARKNAVETTRIAQAMEKDGAAVVRFLVRLEKLVADGGGTTETEAAKMLEACRSEMPGYLGESFSPIPAVGEHGAICHYEATDESASVLGPDGGLFLIDSGGQWEEGTTDITRTVTLGNPTRSQIEDYTLVLKAHIAVAAARFPRGTRGYQIDALARTELWKRGMDYGHGTGHGVGYRLNVHEGPQRLSPHPVDVALEPGMIVSDEPGLYREGEYGIRIENLVICREDGETAFGSFLAFDTLTLAPYDRKLIDIGMLDAAEKDWIDAYHAEVRARLEPLLEGEDAAWLRNAAEPLDPGGEE